MLGGAGSTVDSGLNAVTSLTDDPRERLAKLQPNSRKSSFLSSLDKQNQRTNAQLMANIQNKKAAEQAAKAAQAAKADQAAKARPGVTGGYSLSGIPAAKGGGGSRGQHGLTVPAAKQFNLLSNAYSKKWGQGLSVTSGGRTYEEQAYLYDGYKRGLPGFNLAAPPGTSLHESGIAVDLGGPMTNAGSAQHAWLRQNAAQFGWYWVGQRYGEAWHWEYRG